MSNEKISKFIPTKQFKDLYIKNIIINCLSIYGSHINLKNDDQEKIFAYMNAN